MTERLYLEAPLLLRQRLHQAAIGDDLLDERRERLGLEDLARGHIGDDTGIKIDGNLIAVANLLPGRS